MASTNSASIVGRTFECDLGAIIPRITALSPTRLRVQVTIASQDIDDVVDGGVTDLRPGVVIMNWTEASGNFIVQVQDHEKGVVHNYARLGSGESFCVKGTIREVQAA